LLNGFLTRGNVGAVVLGPASDTDTVPAVAKYSNAGIPVILIDTELNPSAVKASGVKISAFIGSDNLDGGSKAGETLLKALQGKGQKPRVLLLEGLPVHQSAIDRANGFMKAVGDHFDVVRVNGEWSRDKAQEIVASRFTRETFAGIFASNDEMALGAIAALESLHVDQTRWPVIVGFDATPDGLEAIKNGRMFASIRQSGKDLGKIGVLDAVAAVRKSPTIQSRQLLPLSVVSR
jgi:ABC-type sugar transport system substrate-binding protein